MHKKDESIKLRKKYFIDRFVPYSATEYEIVRKTGLDISVVREVLASLDTYYIATWPENLRTEILGYTEVVEMTDDQYKGLEYVLGTLSYRERKCVYEYFRNDMSLKAIGDEFGVSIERIRQIIAKGLRKCRSSSRIQYILVGYDGALARKARVEKEVAAIMARENDEFRAQVQAELEKQKQKSEEIPIENLDLSVRAYNALFRWGIRTAQQLVPYIVEGRLLEIRNLGKLTAIEIEQKFNAYMAAEEVEK